MKLVIGSTYQLSDHVITSIRLFEGRTTRATVSFNQDTFISGELDGNRFTYIHFGRDHLVHDARYVKSTSRELISLGPRKDGTGACMSGYGDRGGFSSIDKPSGKFHTPQILDISDRGMILITDGDGIFYIWDSSTKSMTHASENGDPFKDDIAILIPNEFGQITIFAGAKRLNIRFMARFMARRSNRKSPKFDWEPERHDGENSISSIDYHKNCIVLGLRRSVIIFKLDSERSMPKEPDKLRQVLGEYLEGGSSTEKVKCATLDDDTQDGNASESGKRSEDTSYTKFRQVIREHLERGSSSEDTLDEFESQLKAAQDSNAGDGEDPKFREIDRLFKERRIFAEEIRRYSRNRKNGILPENPDVHI